jgi:hypothetical protein
VGITAIAGIVRGVGVKVMTIEEMTALIEARMSSGADFTFMNLRMLEPIRDDMRAYRLADRLIQKWRKSGRITLRRDGKRVLWSLTKQGPA